MSDDSSWSFAAGLFVGALGGAALATLFTPRSGAQNRETVRDRGLVLKARVNEATTSARESANATASTLRGTANTAVDRVQSTVQTVRTRVSDAAERVSDTAERVGDRVSSITQRSQDTIDTTADHARGTIDTTADHARDAISTTTESARDAIDTTADRARAAMGTTPNTSETPVRRAVAKVYNSPAPTSTAGDLADRVEARTGVAERVAETTEQAAGRAEQAIDTTGGTSGSDTAATRSTDAGTLPDTAAVINGANTLPSTTGMRATTGIQIDTTYSTPSPSQTTAGQTEPLTQPLNVDAGVTDTSSTTAASSIETAVNENDDNAGQLGRNQVGNRYRR